MNIPFLAANIKNNIEDFSIEKIEDYIHSVRELGAEVVDQTFKEFVLNTPLNVDVFYKEQLVLKNCNEYTIRNLQVAAKEGKLDPKEIEFCFYGEEKITFHKLSENFTVTPVFPKGFYSLSYDLAIKLLD